MTKAERRQVLTQRLRQMEAEFDEALRRRESARAEAMIQMIALAKNVMLDAGYDVRTLSDGKLQVV